MYCLTLFGHTVTKEHTTEDLEEIPIEYERDELGKERTSILHVAKKTQAAFGLMVQMYITGVIEV